MKENQALHELATQANIGQRTLDEMNKILDQEENHLKIKTVAQRIPLGQQNEAIRQVLALAYIDGFFSPLEKEMIEEIVKIWNWPQNDLVHILEEAESFYPQSKDNNDNQEELSFAARFLKNQYTSVFSRSFIPIARKLAPETIGRTIERIEREILLSGPEYDEAIQQCAKIAQEDYKYAKIALNRTSDTLKKLEENLSNTIENLSNKTTSKGQANTAKEVAKQLNASQTALGEEIVKELENVNNTFKSKQRALSHFSIAFMGKTKAGKSTLHAILTNEGWNAIGVGKQRTTRQNRVYEWKNIRIIDTPGIGAPGGKTDEEIAQSVIDQCDIICYVVTNDSIQETEFGFMKLLKEKAKPLIILLNIKHNLRDPRRLEHFLNNSEKFFSKTGQSGLKGHFDRIYRYAKEHYNNDYFPIIPVMLLAAQMSLEPEHKLIKSQLFKVSKLQDFLDSIRESLIKHGTIRRSQTLLGSTVGEIVKPEQWVKQQVDIYQKLTDTLKDKRQYIQSDLQKAQRNAWEFLEKEIESIFQDAFNAIPNFAENHWQSNEIEMKNGWQRKMSSIRFEERLKTAFQEAQDNVNQEVQESLEEVGTELQMIAKLQSNNFKFTVQDTSDLVKNLMAFGGGLLAIAALFTPIAPIFGIVGGVMAMLAGFLKSRDQKRREAVQKISSSLRSQLQQQKIKTREQLKNSLNQYCNEVQQNLQNYFEDLIKGLDSIAIHLNNAKSHLSNATNYLNRAYAKRIVDWSLGKYEPLTDKKIKSTVARVTRDFGKSMTIDTKAQLTLHKSELEIKQILQEDICIKSITLNYQEILTMTQTKQSFNPAIVAEKFQKTCDQFSSLLKKGNQQQLNSLAENFAKELHKYQQEGILTVAFVGQYSGGKSTIISALTGKRDIKIDADIATDKTTNYDWNGIKLIDTPGLFTDRQDHDEITYEAINKADLLIFCLTYMLFDSITVENFKKLAYDKSYRWKMMLVINKMSDEAGEDKIKIANYRQSLAEALKPYKLDEFPISFIDAKDYCGGVDTNDDFFLEGSRFSTFIDELNKFVDHRGALARFDTPVRIALSFVEEAQLTAMRNSTEDSAFFEILNQLSRKVRKERSHLRTKVQNIAFKMSSAITGESSPLAAAVGGDEDFESLNNQAEINVQQHYERAENELQAVIDTAIIDIRSEVEEVLTGNLTQTFIACLEKSENISANNVNDNMNFDQLQNQVIDLKKIGEVVGIQLTQLATRGLLPTASKQGLLRSIDVAGSGLHRGVLTIGKFVGFKFKPWQAVNIAKNIGNAAKFLGPALALVLLVDDVRKVHEERKREKQMADVRRDITSEFQSLAKNLEHQIKLQLAEFEAQVYGEIEQQIALARQQQENSIIESNVWMKELVEIRTNFELILKYIITSLN
ncbi:GTPase [Rippkaea orientalis]|uniref:GTPase n=1 Tax=Rippkaea orientalis TaxID=2546366 RepID=UPI0002D583F3|nr:GTPase [Rippkaea orientalis]